MQEEVLLAAAVRLGISGALDGEPEYLPKALANARKLIGRVATLTDEVVGLRMENQMLRASVANIRALASEVCFKPR